ncbi:amidohydrolase family protein [Roseateles violae]|uniref:Amidohydrolase family protein n=1 Tax=Roseateles violae TaxID=3058042 RepID=A0ABT8DYY2_9BURK|nr:amidohydrolase family protein [Pelomonas sp. PFR6]MDN3922779.1 amidohydrolase family protein [Pelomonas sp. PFR6]
MKKTTMLLAALLLMGAAQAREDKVQIHGQAAGTQTVDVAAATTTVDYRYADRGRGDQLKASWTLDEKGLPLRYEARGLDYWHAPIEERFEAAGGRLSWHNRVDRGEQAQTATPAFYLPANAPPEYQAVLARALLKAPGHKLALLPGGEASLRRLQTLQLNGQDLTLYHIAGLDFMPTPIWLHADGSTAAVLTDWLETLPPELLAVRGQLMAAQDAAAQAWHAELARTHLRTPAGGTLLIRNARLFDPRDLSVRERVSVRIVGDRIVQVDEDAKLAAPASGEVIDARGRLLMPGLWDVHQHFSGVDGVFDLIAGVTSARDMANDNEALLARVRRFDAGTELGPRVVLAGIMEGTGPLAGPTDVRIDSVEKALAAVDWYADRGYEQIKIYSSYPPTLIAPTAERAHARGLRVSGHVPAYATARQFIEAGADEIQHLNFILLNFFPEFQETRGKDRYTVAAQKIGAFDLDQPRFAEFVALLRRHGTVLDPTMVTLEGLFSGEPAKAAPALRPVVQRFPIVARRQALSGAVAVPAGHEADYAKALPGFLRMLKRLHEAGVPLMPGTDAFAGYSLHRDLELYVQAGIPNAEVLRLATLGPARVLGAEFDRGVIAPGKRADLILVDGDPLTNIADIRKIHRTIKGGRIIDPLALEQALGIAKP